MLGREVLQWHLIDKLLGPVPRSAGIEFWYLILWKHVHIVLNLDKQKCSDGQMVSTLTSHQCGLGSNPGWETDPSTISEKGFVPV